MKITYLSRGIECWSHWGMFTGIGSPLTTVPAGAPGRR